MLGAAECIVPASWVAHGGSNGIVKVNRIVWNDFGVEFHNVVTQVYVPLLQFSVCFGIRAYRIYKSYELIVAVLWIFFCVLI